MESKSLFPKYLSNPQERLLVIENGYFKSHLLLNVVEKNTIETDWKNGTLQKFAFGLTGQNDPKFFISAIEIENPHNEQYRVGYTMTRI